MRIGEESPSKAAQSVFAILVDEHADMLEAYLRTLLPHSGAIDDLFQETMLIAWRRLSDFDRSRSFGAWIRGIAHNLVLEHLRRVRRASAFATPEVLAEIESHFGRLDRHPRESFASGIDRLRLCVQKLPPPMLEAIQMVYERGMSIVAAAASLGESDETLKKRVQRARQALAECVGLEGAQS